MSNETKIAGPLEMNRLVQRLRSDLKNRDFVLLFAYNGTGKTRLSMAFQEKGKLREDTWDTLYFNAFTEDLFSWDNDLTNDERRVLRLNPNSRFFNGLEELEMENRIGPFLERYADFNFFIDYDKWEVAFFRNEDSDGAPIPIKVSRGEENIFIWCFFLAVAQLAIDGQKAYEQIKYLYVDDPISSLDDNNAIAVACDLARELKKGKGKMKAVVSSHHGLFFNVMCNELKKDKPMTYFLHKGPDAETYSLQKTNDTPFFHHVALLSELQSATESGKLFTHHFNALRNILEKTATFFGYDDFSVCLDKGNEGLHARALNLLSHGGYSIYEPREMVDDNKKIFSEILASFLERYKFQLPKILAEPKKQTSEI